MGVHNSGYNGSYVSGKVFEAVAKLPRHHQKKIVDVVESFVAQYGE
jgi:hypothetical protein